jgi:phosphoglycolate phosphatase
MKKIKACLFDLDGTLLNTIEDIADAMNTSLSDNGLETFSVNDYKMLVGAGASQLVDDIIKKLGCGKDVKQRLLKDFLDESEKNKFNKTKPYDGVMEMLKELKKRKIFVGIITNKNAKEAKEVADHYFKDLYNEISGVVDGKHVKPDATRIKKMLKDHSFDTEEVLYFGDTKIDMQTAENADVDAVGVVWGFRGQQELEKSGAIYLIDKPAQILHILDDIDRLVEKGTN